MDKAWPQIAQYLDNNQVSIYGVADVRALEEAPEGHRPSDLLKGARSLICLALPVARGVYLAGPRTPKMYWRQANLHYRHLDLLASRLAAMIEGDTGAAALVPACYPFDLKSKGDFWGVVSLVKMAEAAGLGRVGVNGLLMHPRFGPRLHLSGLVTTLELPPLSAGGAEASPCPEGCRACLEACPAAALDGQGGVDRLACVRKSSQAPIFNWFMKHGGFKAEDAEVLVHLTTVDDHQMYSCLNCVSACRLL